MLKPFVNNTDEMTIKRNLSDDITVSLSLSLCVCVCVCVCVSVCRNISGVWIKPRLNWLLNSPSRSGTTTSSPSTTTSVKPCVCVCVCVCVCAVLNVQNQQKRSRCLSPVQTHLIHIFPSRPPLWCGSTSRRTAAITFIFRINALTFPPRWHIFGERERKEGREGGRERGRREGGRREGRSSRNQSCQNYCLSFFTSWSRTPK